MPQQPPISVCDSPATRQWVKKGAGSLARDCCELEVEMTSRPSQQLEF